MMDTFDEVDELLTDVYFLESQDQGRSASQLLIHYIVKKQKTASYRDIDHLVGEIDTKQLNVHSLIAMVRCTWSFKMQLEHWDPMFVNAWKRMDELGKDSSKLFVGFKRPF